MTPPPTGPGSDLRALCDLAGRQAAGGPALRPAARGGRSRVAGVLLGAVALAAIAAAAGLLWPDDTPPVAAALPAPEASPWDRLARTGAGVGRADVSPAPEAPPLRASRQVWWDDGELVVTFVQAPLPQAVRKLARATGAQVRGIELLDAGARITLQGRFADPSQAWVQMLRRHARHGLACGGAGCSVWIDSGVAAASAAPGMPARTTGDDAPSDEEISQPDGAC